MGKTVIVVLATWAFCSFTQAGAQVSAPAPATSPAPSSATPPVEPAPAPLPVVDPAKELKGAALVEALRKGGFVFYMRHATTGTVTQVCEKSNLSPIGEEQARNVGAAIRDLKIPIGAVRTSQPCRCVDTARLLGLGEVDITEDLNPSAPREGFDIIAARFRRLGEAPAAGTNTVLVSHLHGSRNKAEWLHLEMGEIIVFRPVAGARPEPVARIQVAEWQALKKAIAN